MKKRCLVTGASGFIGSHLVDYLVKKKYSVILFDQKSPQLKIKNQKFYLSGIKNFKTLDKATKKIDILFHFAASADLNESNDKPFLAIEDNINGTVNVLKACVKNKIKKIIFASSIYSVSEQGGIYSTTKLASEMIIERICKKYDIKFVILRFGTVYGERANKFNTVKNFIDEAKRNKNIFRNTQGKEIRSYINVKDVVKIVFLLNQKKYENGYYNIFGNQKITVKNLLNRIKKKIPGTEIFYSKKDNRKYNYKTNPFTYKLRKGKEIKLKKYVNLEDGLNKLIF
jgi:UDP-glucose 4-epimerase